MEQQIAGEEWLRQAESALEPTLLELLLKASPALPRRWRQWPSDRGFEHVRCRLEFTQAELALKAGIPQSQVSRVEGGRDALLSTWRKVYAAMGFDLLLVPVSSLTVDELKARAEQSRPARLGFRQRARPRRRWFPKTAKSE